MSSELAPASDNRDDRDELTTLTPARFVQIDEEGYFMMEGLRIADADAGRKWLENLTVDERGRFWTRMTDEPIFVEAFDEPYVALDLDLQSPEPRVTMPYSHAEAFSLSSLTLDSFDRFHGRTLRGVPFVLSRAAQARFFEKLEDYDDESITVAGSRIPTGPWLADNPDATRSDWWTSLYEQKTTPWDLGRPSPALASVVPQLKLQRSRILVLGCGAGHDAAWFASQGHIVTGVDFSGEALAQARAKYSGVADLTFVQADAFNLPSSMTASFDIVFEHTLYCAIVPSQRAALIKAWRRALTENGHLLGIFETRDKQWGPPYGGSEWDVRARLIKSFQMLYWMRFRGSFDARSGQEFVVYAQRLQTF